MVRLLNGAHLACSQILPPHSRVETGKLGTPDGHLDGPDPPAPPHPCTFVSAINVTLPGVSAGRFSHRIGTLFIHSAARARHYFSRLAGVRLSYAPVGALVTQQDTPSIARSVLLDGCARSRHDLYFQSF